MDATILRTDTVASADLSAALLVSSFESEVDMPLGLSAILLIGDSVKPLAASPGDTISISAIVGDQAIAAEPVAVPESLDGLRVNLEPFILLPGETIEIRLQSSNVVDDDVAVTVVWLAMSVLQQLNSTLGVSRVYAARVMG